MNGKQIRKFKTIKEIQEEEGGALPTLEGVRTLVPIRRGREAD